MPIDLARTDVKGRKEVEGHRTLILMFGPVGNILRLGWQSRGQTGSRLQGSLFVHGQHDRMGRLVAMNRAVEGWPHTISSVDGSRGARGDLTFLTIGSGAVFCPAC